MDKLANPSQFLDLGGLDTLRAKAQKQDKSALEEVARQFEGIFVQMLMQSMREANAAFESDSPFNSQYTKFYEQMRDQQLSVELGAKGTLGLADIIVQQLSPQTSGIMPASALRGALNVSEATNQGFPQLIADKGRSGKVLPSTQVSQTKPIAFDSPLDFINQLYPYAKQAASSLGTQPEVLLAQSALETGWGKKILQTADGASSHNLFNIKADSRWQGPSAQVRTLEFEQGVAVKRQADFRVYDSLAQSFEDFVNFISSSERYQQAREMAAKPHQFIQELQNAGYATDPDYASKIMRVMKSVVSLIPTTGDNK